MTTDRSLGQAPADRLSTFRYAVPEGRDFPKKSMRLAKRGLLSVAVQVINAGGETNMHAHTGEDEAWLVIGGRARFHGGDGEPPVELGPREGIVVPAGVPYWFESASAEQLEIVRMAAGVPGVRDERVNYQPLSGWQREHGLEGRAPIPGEGAGA
jgi:mannose-6-phosphate isomerase-like protein (cupin superfamily)